MRDEAQEKRDKFLAHLEWAREEVAKWPEWKRNLLGSHFSDKRPQPEPMPTPYEILMAFFEKFGKEVDVYDFRIVSKPPEPTRYQIKARHYKTYEWCPKKKYWWDHDNP